MTDRPSRRVSPLAPAHRQRRRLRPHRTGSRGPSCDAHRDGIVTSTSVLTLAPGFDKTVGWLARRARARHRRPPRRRRRGSAAAVAPARSRPWSTRRGALHDCRGAGSCRWPPPVASIPTTCVASSPPSSSASPSAGVTIDHLDTHQNLHLWPMVRAVVMELGEQHGVRADPGHPLGGQLGRSGRVVRRLASRLEAAADERGWVYPDATTGLDEAGHLDLRRHGRRPRSAWRRAGTAHRPSSPPIPVSPTTPTWPATEWGYQWADELSALCSHDRAHRRSTSSASGSAPSPTSPTSATPATWREARPARPTARHAIALFDDAPRGDRFHVRMRWWTCPFAAVEARGAGRRPGARGRLRPRAAVALPRRPQPPSREVVGVDIDADKIELARAAAARSMPDAAGGALRRGRARSLPRRRVRRRRHLRRALPAAGAGPAPAARPGHRPPGAGWRARDQGGRSGAGLEEHAGHRCRSCWPPRCCASPRATRSSSPRPTDFAEQLARRRARRVPAPRRSRLPAPARAGDRSSRRGRVGSSHCEAHDDHDGLERRCPRHRGAARRRLLRPHGRGGRHPLVVPGPPRVDGRRAAQPRSGGRRARSTSARARPSRCSCCETSAPRARSAPISRCSHCATLAGEPAAAGAVVPGRAAAVRRRVGRSAHLDRGHRAPRRRRGGAARVQAGAAARRVDLHHHVVVHVPVERARRAGGPPSPLPAARARASGSSRPASSSIGSRTTTRSSCRRPCWCARRRSSGS